ncbi:MAG: integrase core domain-containing protein [Rhodobacterales bacterium]
MDIHKNARTTPGMRDLIAGRRQAKETPGRIAGVSGGAEVTLRRWIARHSAEGQAGLVNRSARPHRMQPRPGDDRRTRVEGLRRARQPFRKIAASVGLSCAAVARTGKPCGFGHLSAPDPRPGITRGEKATPGGMTHIDIRKLGRSDGIGHRITGDRTGQSSLGQSNASSRQDSGTGWESLHLAVDDHWHLGCSKMFPGGTRKSCLTFVFPALRFLRNHSVRVWRVMTDNGVSFRSRRCAKVLRMLGIRHKRTRPCTPGTNGKAERFDRTSLREWACAAPYAPSDQHRDALKPCLHHSNTHRPPFAPKGKTPLSGVPDNNLSGHDS